MYVCSDNCKLLSSIMTGMEVGSIAKCVGGNADTQMGVVN